MRNPYSGDVQYGTFTIPFLSGFSGHSNGWIQSYFDLSDYAGEEVTIRFRFGTDDNTAAAGDAWYVDEVEVLDLLNYNGQACVTADASNSACAILPEKGVIVQPATVGTDEIFASNRIALTALPNPASDLLHLTVDQPLSGAVSASLFPPTAGSSELHSQWPERRSGTDPGRAGSAVRRLSGAAGKRGGRGCAESGDKIEVRSER